jgi:monolysocardiolipin acyltransferase
VTTAADLWMRRVYSGGLATFAWMNMHFFNRTRVIGAENLNKLVHRTDRGLLTISNHVSGLDDPCVLAAILPLHLLADPEAMRWTLCATDRCFRSTFWAHVFPHVKCVPIIRGAGIDQPLMGLAIDLLRAKYWVNMFPEGTRTASGEIGTFRIGTGKLIADAEPSPYVVPIFHRGMERMLPLGTRVPRFGNRIDIIVGEPLTFDEMIAEYRAEGRSETELYLAIAAALEVRVRALQDRLLQPNDE